MTSPAFTVCFDALGTCFGMEVLIEAVEDLLGEELKKAGSCARMTVMDWFHSAQRDFTYLSLISPPPPPISQILTLTLPRSLTYALTSTPSLDPASALALPDLTPITSKLTSLTPNPGLEECFKSLNKAGAKVVIITNGAKATTQGYVDQAGLTEWVDEIGSCDEVGLAKPFSEVYTRAVELCIPGKGEKGDGGEKWFVAAHMWDLAAARKAGFKTGVVLAEQPPLGTTKDGKKELDAWYALYGGKPDITGATLDEVAKKIIEAVKAG